jgi:peptidoglycan/LPS O-acetylase OafA/YrhL
MHFEEYRDRRFFGSLDGIRAGSILAVIWHHATPRGGYNLPMFDRGFLGVDMFFVLSGFLIVTLLLRERDRNGNISLKNFYARRTLRIFPVYYALLGALTALYLIKPDAGSASAFFEELPFHLSYTSNWIDASVLAFTWSLATEEQFYLFWPPVERYLKPFAIPILFVVIAFSQLVNFGVFDSQLHSLFGESSEILHILQVTFTPICLGVLVAHILHTPKGFAKLAKFCGGRFQPIVGSALVLLACNLPGDDISGWIRLSVHITMTFLLISLVVREDHLLQRALNIPIIKRMGAISYGMYLFHVFAVTAVLKVMDQLSLSHALIAFLLTTLLTILISEISFRFFENPIMRWKKRFNS